MKKPDIIIKKGIDNYGMKLIKIKNIDKYSETK